MTNFIDGQPYTQERACTHALPAPSQQTRTTQGLPYLLSRALLERGTGVLQGPKSSITDTTRHVYITAYPPFSLRSIRFSEPVSLPGNDTMVAPGTEKRTIRSCACAYVVWCAREREREGKVTWCAYSKFVVLLVEGWRCFNLWL